MPIAAEGHPGHVRHHVIAIGCQSGVRCRRVGSGMTLFVKNVTDVECWYHAPPAARIPTGSPRGTP
jgi:pyruvate formate-lyase activating enzyme-like uncharacterized protein